MGTSKKSLPSLIQMKKFKPSALLFYPVFIGICLLVVFLVHDKHPEMQNLLFWYVGSFVFGLFFSRFIISPLVGAQSLVAFDSQYIYTPTKDFILLPFFKKFSDPLEKRSPIKDLKFVAIGNLEKLKSLQSSKIDETLLKSVHLEAEKIMKGKRDILDAEIKRPLAFNMTLGQRIFAGNAVSIWGTPLLSVGICITKRNETFYFSVEALPMRDIKKITDILESNGVKTETSFFGENSKNKRSVGSWIFYIVFGIFVLGILYFCFLL